MCPILTCYTSYRTVVGTREQALVYALSAAAVTHAVARACAAGLVPQCGCAAPPSRPPDGAFQWGGCSDDLRWAQQFARQFVDSADRKPVEGGGDGQRRDLLALVNLHNNRAGRRVCPCYTVYLLMLCTPGGAWLAYTRPSYKDY